MLKTFSSIKNLAKNSRITTRYNRNFILTRLTNILMMLSTQNIDVEHSQKSEICTSKAGIIFHHIESKNLLQSEKYYVPELDAKW